MNPQPKPSIDCFPGAREGADRPAHSRARVLVAGSRALVPWPVELEVEPWHP